MNEEFWVRLLLSCALLVTAPAHLLTNPLSPGTDAIGEEERCRQCLIRPGPEEAPNAVARTTGRRARAAIRGAR